MDGLLINANPGTSVIIIAVVNADPCPTVQWSFAESNILNDSDYTVSNPCISSLPNNFCDVDNEAACMYRFTLTITALTLNQSGTYSAVFSNQYGSISLPNLVVTVPGNVGCYSNIVGNGDRNGAVNNACAHT